MTSNRDRLARLGSLMAVASMLACADSEPGSQSGADADITPMDAGAADAETTADSATAPTDATYWRCVSGEQTLLPCPQPDPACPGPFGYSASTCQANGTPGECECVDDPAPRDPPDPETAAACMEAAPRVFTNACSDCLCGESQRCAQAVLGCGDDCQVFLRCLAPCVFGATIDSGCFVKCAESVPPEAITAFGPDIPNCIVRCPDECLTGIVANPPMPDADGGQD